MKAHEIAKSAAALVGGPRENQHGDKHLNAACIAAVWRGVEEARRLSGRPYDALHAFNLMEAMKIARRYSGSHNIDDYVDGAGYAACAGEIAGSMNKPTGEGG